MYSPAYVNHVYQSDILPPLHVKKSVKKSKEWKIAVLDAFEHLGLKQIDENREFHDYYRMVKGDLSYQELSDVIPHLDNLQDLLDGVGVPTYLKHYDIIGLIVNAIVGKYAEFEDKFHVTDTGEIADNDFLRFKNEEIQKQISEQIKKAVELGLAKAGINPNENKSFNSPEEQQQYLERLDQIQRESVPKNLQKDSTKSFKTIGMKWGEATLDKDKTAFNLRRMEKEELKDRLLSGRYFRHYRIGHDYYKPERWDPKTVFFSKDLESERPQDCSYVGRVMILTPEEVDRNWGHLMTLRQREDLLGGNESWKNFVGDGVISGSINRAIDKNFNEQRRVPFSNFYDYNFILGLEDELNMPMGNFTYTQGDKEGKTYDTFLPRMINDTHGRYNYYANMIRQDFIHRPDICQITEVYFKAWDRYGFLTYENEYGRIVTAEVTEDILSDFIKENNIKQKFTESLHETVNTFEPGTLKWILIPRVYKGLKVQSGNLEEQLYLYCEENDYQIKADSEFDVMLPVGGWIGDSWAKKIDPYQSGYNFCMNQIYSLLEKEIGMFFLMDINLIPSEFDQWGDAQEALIALRNIAKDVGFMPVATSGDAQKNSNTFNQFSTYDISYTKEIQTRIQLADFYKRKAFEAIGVSDQMLHQPTKYETATGVKQNVETANAQLSDIFEDFTEANRGVLELHLAASQYAQSNKKDLSIHYTKSDASFEYLRITDPEFPLRRLGLIPSVDSDKRKELEEFKARLLNTNTIGSDTLELARLISSDAMTEVLEIAERERKVREERAQQEHERALELQRQGARMEEEKAQREWEREEISNQRDRNTDIAREEIKAKGRAADKESNTVGFQEIEEAANKATQNALKDKSLNMQHEKNIQDYNLEERKEENRRQEKIKELNLKAKQLQVDIQKNKDENYRAEINKN